MPPSSPQNEILRQLAEIQRLLGETTATVAGMKEDITTHISITGQFRNTVSASVDNIMIRTGQLEDSVKALNMVIEKTVKPLAMGVNNNRQRVIGFMAAWGLVASAAGLVGWLIGSGWETIVKAFIR